MGTVDVNFSLLQTSKYLKSHKDNFFKIMKVFANITQIILTDSPKKPKGHTKDYTIEGHTLFTFFSEIHPIQGTKDKSASRQYQLFIFSCGYPPPPITAQRKATLHPALSRLLIFSQHFQ